MIYNLKYFLTTVILFIIEVLIATVFKNYVFLRSFFGDVLVVILIYTFIRSFFKVHHKTKLIVGIFIFSVFIEMLQYFKTADLLGFRPGSWQQIVLGNSFSWIDILCYAAGCLVIWFFENYFSQKKASSKN